MLYEIAPENKIKVFEETGDVDFAYEIPNLARYRANYFQQKWGVGAVFREIPSTILTAEQLGLPKVITKLSMLHKGMVLVTGPTGSGKSTIVDLILGLQQPIKGKIYFDNSELNEFNFDSYRKKIRYVYSCW